MTVFPFAEVERHRLATMFKNLLASKRFDLKFMYAGLDGRAVRLVFSVTHNSNPIVNNHGLPTPRLLPLRLRTSRCTG